MAHPNQAPASEQRLRPGVLTTLDVIAQSFAYLGPVTGAAFVTSLVAASAGAAAPLAVLVAGTLCVTIGYVLAQLAARIHHAGCIYEYVNRSLGPGAGSLAGWMYFTALALFCPAILLGLSAWIADFVRTQTGFACPWYAVTVALCVPLYLLTLFDIRIATRTQLTITVVSVAVVLAVVGVILLRGGESGHTLEVFSPAASSRGWQGVSFGLIYALTFFAGFESSATLAEETADPRRSLPVAVIGSVTLVAAFYLLVCYAFAIGYGPASAGQWASDTGALQTMAGRYVGAWLGPVVFATAVLDAFAVALGCLTAASRVAYALGRDGLLPAALGRVHPRHQTPYVASGALLLGSLLLGLPFAFTRDGAMTGFAYINGIAIITFQVIYIIALVGAVVYFRRGDAGKFCAGRHLAAPAAGILGCAAALYGSLQAPPGPLFVTMPYVAAALAALGLIAARKRISSQ